MNELKGYRSLNYELLKGDRQGQISLRLNKQYRLIITKVINDELLIYIEEISKHYEEENLCKRLGSSRSLSSW